MAKKPKKRSWIVRARKEAYVEFVTKSCTEEEARTQPDAFAVEETVLEIINLYILYVRPND